MNLQSLVHRPGFVRWGLRIDMAPSWVWLALVPLALWPTGLWMARRMADGSDDPLGLLALGALAAVVAVNARGLRASPRLGWLALALAGTLASTLSLGRVPPLVSALPGLAALGCALAAFLPRHVASAPVLGLAVLSLPLLASLQFYAGYPLRVVTAEAGRWLLAPWFAVERSGTALRVDGVLVIVDAPCSGVQMLWLGYFTACCAALYAGRRSRTFLARLPAVSALVLAGNVLRNAVLVAGEASGRALAPWAHDAVGLAVLAAVCAGVAAFMTQSGARAHADCLGSYRNHSERGA